MESLVAAEESRLGELEIRIERGLKTFIEVGTALMEIRESRLYRAAHATVVKSKLPRMAAREFFIWRVRLGLAGDTEILSFR